MNFEYWYLGMSVMFLIGAVCRIIRCFLIRKDCSVVSAIVVFLYVCGFGYFLLKSLHII